MPILGDHGLRETHATAEVSYVEGEIHNARCPLIGENGVDGSVVRIDGKV